MANPSPVSNPTLLPTIPKSSPPSKKRSLPPNSKLFRRRRISCAKASWPKSITSLNCFESRIVLTCRMSFASAARKLARFPHRKLCAALRLDPDCASLASVAQFCSCSPKHLLTPGNSAIARSPLFSYLYKHLHPQLLSFDTHTNSPGVAYRSPRRVISPCSPLTGRKSLPSRALFHSLSKKQNVSPVFSSLSALFAQNCRGVPQNASPEFPQ